MTEKLDLKQERLTKDQALDMLRQMWEIRMFENRVYELLGRNVIKGASHLYAGQEAVAVGAISTLRDDDLITSTHRGHGHCHARGAAIHKAEGDRVTHYNKMLAELCGRATGYCYGRGGSMHIADVENGNLGATGIVGGNIPVATGAALAQQAVVGLDDRKRDALAGGGQVQFGTSDGLVGSFGPVPVPQPVEQRLSQV